MKKILNFINPNLRAAIDAAFIIAIGMGFGRFSFTGIYPYMVQEGILNLKFGSLSASINCAGYLLGALLALKIKADNSRHLCLWSSIGTIFSLAILNLSTYIPLIIFIRGIAGIFSALAMVAVSLWLLEYHKQLKHAPILYSGVGIGIVLSAELVVIGTSNSLDSRKLWLLLAIFSSFLIWLVINSLKKKVQPNHCQITANSSSSHFTITKQLPLIILYGLAGFGYIITATYLPLLVKDKLPQVNSAHIWAIFGIAAIPSCFIWHVLHQKWGTRISLFTNLILQAFGVISPLIFPSAIGYIFSAIIVGGTFMGTVTITMPVAQYLAKKEKNNLIALMTIIYSIGQIIGPIVANSLFTITHSLNTSLITAFFALCLAALISIMGNNFFKLNSY